MSNLLLHRAPSVGAIIKKMMVINPELSAQEMIEFVRQSIETQGQDSGEFALAEMINEEKALELVRRTVGSPSRRV